MFSRCGLYTVFTGNKHMQKVCGQAYFHLAHAMSLTASDWRAPSMLATACMARGCMAPGTCIQLWGRQKRRSHQPKAVWREAGAAATSAVNVVYPTLLKP